MDKRKNYYLTIDTETANSMDEPLVYDIGGCVHDNKGNIYETFSFVIREIFDNHNLIKSAYYYSKRFLYYTALRHHKAIKVNFYEARKHILDLCEKYNIKAIIAHNARFDYRALTTTQRYLTKSKYKYFLPYGVPIWDTLKMAQDTICKQKSYIRFCKDNGFCQKNGKPRATAEILYRYISGNYNFDEEHTALADALIESEIFTQCMRQHKKMRKEVWSK